MGDLRLLESFLVSVNSFSFGGVRFDVEERWMRNGSLRGMVWVRRCSFGYADFEWQWTVEESSGLASCGFCRASV